MAEYHHLRRDADRCAREAARPARPAGLRTTPVPAPEPVYIWHEVPAHLDSAEQQRLATRAIPTLLLAGYKVNCTPEVFDQAAYQQALHDIRSGTSRQTTHPPGGPAATSRRPAPTGRTP
ncbi:hypothetical protein AB0O04_34600 [Streptomyces althioticus]|uniref:hypothetical protein n=1 Tax=Streptomyces althioticus TaxID=83380 RepID=UPI003414894B